MKTWIIEEYQNLPAVLCSMYRENRKRPDGIYEEKIQFGEDKHQYLMLFKPSKREQKKNAILFLHGGAWAVGSPSLFAFAGRFFSKLGFNVILGGYRHAPRYKHPAQIEDVYGGLTEGIKALKQRGVFKDKLIVAGQSSGAHLGALLVVDKENALRHGIDPSIFSAMVLISGPLDFSVCNAKQVNIGLNGFLDSKKDFYEADPIRLVKRSDATPVMCIHGARDPVVDIRNSINFYNRIRVNSDGVSKLVIAEDKHHLDMLKLFIENNKETKAVSEFLYEIEKM